MSQPIYKSNGLHTPLWSGLHSGLWSPFSGSALASQSTFANIVSNGTLANYVTFTRASSATYFDSAGVMQTALTNVPRIDYDPSTLALRGLLIEEARTNLLTYSADFSNAAWTKTNLTAALGVTAPDGSSNGWTLTVVTTGAATSASRAAGAATATAMTASLYLKAGTRTATIQLLLRNNTTTTNFTTGQWNPVTGGITGTGWAATAVGGGWYRATYTQSTGITIGDNISLYYGALGGTGFTSGETWVAWGAQLEAGSFATSYIPTTSAAVTRAADVAVVSDLTDIGHDASGWTLYVECIAPPAVGAVYPGAVALVESGGATDNASGILFTPTSGNRVRGNTRTAAVSTEITGLTGYAIGATYKAALAVESGSQAISVNGGAPVTSASGIPNGLAKLLIGQRIDGSWHFGSQIKTLRYYPRRLTNAELVAMTA